MIVGSIPAGLSPQPYTQRSVSGRDLISIQDFTPEELACVLELAAAMKARPADYGALAGKQIVLFFEKPSLRTRLTFEAGINSLGGVSFFVDQTQSRAPRASAVPAAIARRRRALRTRRHLRLERLEMDQVPDRFVPVIDIPAVDNGADARGDFPAAARAQRLDFEIWRQGTLSGQEIDFAAHVGGPPGVAAAINLQRQACELL